MGRVRGHAMTHAESRVSIDHHDITACASALLILQLALPRVRATADLLSRYAVLLHDL